MFAPFLHSIFVGTLTSPSFAPFYSFVMAETVGILEIGPTS
jgi:hypothetical protein